MLSIHPGQTFPGILQGDSPLADVGGSSVKCAPEIPCFCMAGNPPAWFLQMHTLVLKSRPDLGQTPELLSHRIGPLKPWKQQGPNPAGLRGCL